VSIKSKESAKDINNHPFLDLTNYKKESFCMKPDRAPGLPANADM
jgi:hypothetical protein